MIDSLSESQLKIVQHTEGKSVVRACPGSGKTYSVAAKLLYHLESWKSLMNGIATISFTNVAWKEIDLKLKENIHSEFKIRHPHFLGTIDSFINRFILLPHGHLILKCNERPKLVGSPHGYWIGRNYSESTFDKLTFDIDGNLYAPSPRLLNKDWDKNKHIHSAKSKLNKQGFSTQSDANYFAMLLLRQYPQIAESVANRFPLMIVDEAQDTSDIQMNILDSLIENGLENIIIVGDPDQAIFEWNKARPDLFNEKFESWHFKYVLNESRRSSQLICNCTYHLSSLGENSLAVNNEVKDLILKPILKVYGKDLNEIVDDFLRICLEQDIQIAPEKVAIIYRSKSLYNEITGIEPLDFRNNPWSSFSDIEKAILIGLNTYRKGEVKKGFKIIQDCLVKIHFDTIILTEQLTKKCIEDLGYFSLKEKVYNLLINLPYLQNSLSDWIEGSNKILSEIGFKFQNRSNYAKIEVDQLFAQQAKKEPYKNCKIGTVHSVKGETYDAVLLFLKTRGIGKGYKKLIKEDVSILDNEELRIVYVGITRPRKLLYIAVPNEKEKESWKLKLNIVD